MAMVFLIFLVAVLAVWSRPDGRAQRINRLKAFGGRGASFARSVLSSGERAIDRAAGGLAQEQRTRVGLSELFTPAEPPADGVEHSAER